MWKSLEKKYFNHENQRLVCFIFRRLLRLFPLLWGLLWSGDVRHKMHKKHLTDAQKAFYWCTKGIWLMNCPRTTPTRSSQATPSAPMLTLALTPSAGSFISFSRIKCNIDKILNVPLINDKQAQQRCVQVTNWLWHDGASRSIFCECPVVIIIISGPRLVFGPMFFLFFDC